MVRKTKRRSHMRKTSSGKITPVREHMMKVTRTRKVSKPSKKERKLLEKAIKKEIKQDKKLHDKLKKKHEQGKEITDEDIEKIENRYKIKKNIVDGKELFVAKANDLDFAIFEKKSDAVSWVDWRVMNRLNDIEGRKQVSEPKNLKKKHLVEFETKRTKKQIDEDKALWGTIFPASTGGLSLLSLISGNIPLALVSIGLSGLTFVSEGIINPDKSFSKL